MADTLGISWVRFFSVHAPNGIKSDEQNQARARMISVSLLCVGANGERRRMRVQRCCPTVPLYARRCSFHYAPCGKNESEQRVCELHSIFTL